ncbi:MAG: hypothetical protein DME97_04605 [Verrucomicrobia bacterium]|nr:MAG: hypothetical protein DME97_04605 [Verrucomicrobiota bacterium]
MVNRAVSAFPPGSTFKLVTTLAGLRRGLATKTFNCGGGVSYGDHFFHCWIGEKGGSHGTLGVSDAIKVSCNSFFYQFGNAAGIEAIDETGDSLGLGKTSGIEITSESPGVLPGPEWMRIHYPRERWSQAYTANVSIGQGYNLLTPLQLAMVYATVANGGVSYYPKLVQSVTSMVDGKPILNEKGEPVVNPAPRIHHDLRFDFPPQLIQLARRGLWKVVNEDGGTAARARLQGVQVAGKTGTAQAMTEGKKDTIAWFVCFAPFDNPKYTIAVMVQGGEHGGSVAAPIATRILERALAMDQGTFQQQVAWIAPARKANPFQMIPAVEFKDSGPKLAATDEENLDGSTSSDMANTSADPSVEPEADAAGKVKKAPRPVVVATPPPRKLSFFERLFGVRPKPAPAPTPPPKQRPVRR